MSIGPIMLTSQIEDLMEILESVDFLAGFERIVRRWSSRTCCSEAQWAADGLSVSALPASG
jgi:hypothetical protein